MTTTSPTTTGPDFISLQVRDLAASAAFYEDALGLCRLPATNPEAVLFSDGNVTFAVRTPLPGVDLDAHDRLGAGIALWFTTQDAGAVHDRLLAAGTEIVQAPFTGPFGIQFTLRDPDGYLITVHSQV